MSTNLLLNSFEVRGFRAFRHLQIKRLGRVNLITGKNNVGKSCLLEALCLYATRGSLLTMRQLLESRDEIAYATVHRSWAVRNLLWERKSLEDQPDPVQIGPVDFLEQTLRIEIVWYKEQQGSSGQRQWTLTSDQADSIVSVPGVRILWHDQPILGYPFEIDFPELRQVSLPKKFKELELPYAFIPANGLTRGAIASWWDKIALTALEQDVVAALKLIAPGVERVNLVGHSTGDGERIPLVKMTETREPLPLRSLGDGMNRLFGIALALVNAKEGLLLIDEIDSGLHYSVQADLWRLVFAVAERLNIQVFATTHSWDCISAFQQAAAQHTTSSGMLIRLSEKNGDIVSTVFDEQRLAIATREQIEVR
jgi:predicted ATPase